MLHYSPSSSSSTASHLKEGQEFPLVRSESGHLKVMSTISSSKLGHRRSTTSSTSPQRRRRRRTHRRGSAKAVEGSVSGSPSSSTSSTSDEADLTSNGRSQGVQKSQGSLNVGLGDDLKTGPQPLSRPRRSAKRSSSQRNRLPSNTKSPNEGKGIFIAGH